MVLNVLDGSGGAVPGPRQEGARRVAAAPYVPYPALKAFLVQLSKSGIPEQIEARTVADTTVSNGNHLVVSLRFLRLVDAHGQPTEALLRLINSMASEDWPRAMELTLRNAYRPLFQMDLANARPTEFIAAFDQNYGGAPSVRRKSRTFFLHAAQDAGIALSPAIIRTTKPRGHSRPSPTGGRPGGAPAPRPPGTPGPAPPRALGPVPPRALGPVPPRAWPIAAASSHGPGSGPGLAEQLLSRVDIRELRPTEQRAFWAVLKMLKERGL
jgi:Family of unknown function (DUF5343)